jgi:hypothetical protein
MWRIWLLTLSGGLALAAAPAVREDAPSSSAPTSGSVTVQIAPAAKVKEMYALCRATGQRFKPQRADLATGQAVFDNLPGDAHYDIGVVTSDGWQVEGIDLSWHEDRLLRLAAKRRVELGLPSEAAHEFSRADADELLKYVRDLQAFEDVRRVLYLRGDGQRAVMLVEPMRAREFYNRQADGVVVFPLSLRRVGAGGQRRAGAGAAADFRGPVAATNRAVLPRALRLSGRAWPEPAAQVDSARKARSCPWPLGRHAARPGHPAHNHRPAGR